MTKEELIEKLEDIFARLDEITSTIDDIYGTPIDEIDELLNGKKSVFGLKSTQIEKDGLITFGRNVQSDLEELLDELKESI